METQYTPGPAAEAKRLDDLPFEGGGCCVNDDGADCVSGIASEHKISIARVLGDYGAAVDYARQVDPNRIITAERRARYWEDTALALYGRGRPTAAFQVLTIAERDTPQEVRYRPWAQQLTRDLMATDTRNSLPDIRDFARRVGAVA